MSKGQKKDLLDPVFPHCHWLGTHSSCQLPGGPDSSRAYDRHPNILLIKLASYIVQLLSWKDLVVLAEYTTEKWMPSSHLTKALHTKAYLTFFNQPWHCFILSISL